MTDILLEYIELFGLNYQPTTFADAFGWLVLSMASISIVCGIIRIMFEITTVLKGGKYR